MAHSKMAVSLRRVMEKPRLPTKRKLFDMEIDHQEIKEALDAQRRSLDDHFKKTWNFDFVKERPLSGNFQWTQIKPDTVVPGAYEMPQLLKKFDLKGGRTPLATLSPNIMPTSPPSAERQILKGRRRSTRLSPTCQDGPGHTTCSTGLARVQPEPEATPSTSPQRTNRRRSLRGSPPCDVIREEEFGSFTLPEAPPAAGNRRVSVGLRRLSTSGGNGPITRRASLCLPRHLVGAPAKNAAMLDFAATTKRKQQQKLLPDQLQVVKRGARAAPVSGACARRQTLGGHCCELSAQLCALQKENQPAAGKGEKTGSPAGWAKRRRLSTLLSVDSPGKRSKTFSRRHSLDVPGPLRQTPMRAVRAK